MKDIKLEKAFTDLEEIVQKLEQGELPLDDLIGTYEKGIKLVRLCTNKLQEAEKKVKKLVEDEDGNFKTDLFE
jgi:exodeoxyribonuclease VII small subunit